MSEYVLTGSRFAYRDKDNVLVIKRRGDKVDLNPEQEQRLRAGQPGSAFQKADDVEEPEMVEVAVANESTTPAEDGSAPASPDGTANRKVPATAIRPRQAKTEEGADEAPTPEPVTSTAKTAPKGAAK